MFLREPQIFAYVCVLSLPNPLSFVHRQIGVGRDAHITPQKSASAPDGVGSSGSPTPTDKKSNQQKTTADITPAVIFLQKCHLPRVGDKSLPPCVCIKNELFRQAPEQLCLFYLSSSSSSSVSGLGRISTLISSMRRSSIERTVNLRFSYSATIGSSVTVSGRYPRRLITKPPRVS